jgi:hypothetical protein
MSFLAVIVDFDWMLIATVATAVFAAVAAVAALCAARETRRAAEAQVLLNVLTDYAAHDMSDALRLLRDWYTKDTKGFAEKWKVDFDNRVPEAMEIDRARRRVTSYFQNLDQLHRQKVISPGTWGAAVDKSGLAVFLVVGQSLERRLSPEVDLSFADRLSKQYPERTRLF